MIKSTAIATLRRTLPQSRNLFHILAKNRGLSSSGTTSTQEENNELALKLYQYQICPFCNKVKALLDYSNINYSIAEVNPLTKSELKFSGDYKKVPIAEINGQQVNGSDEILEYLLQEPIFCEKIKEKWIKEEVAIDPVERNIPNYDMDFLIFDNNDTTEWSNWASDELASVLYPNLCGTLSDSYKAFSYVDDVQHFSSVQKTMIRTVGSFAMYMAASKIKSKLMLLQLF